MIKKESFLFNSGFVHVTKNILISHKKLPSNNGNEVMRIVEFLQKTRFVRKTSRKLSMDFLQTSHSRCIVSPPPPRIIVPKEKAGRSLANRVALSLRKFVVRRFLNAVLIQSGQTPPTPSRGLLHHPFEVGELSSSVGRMHTSLSLVQLAYPLFESPDTKRQPYPQTRSRSIAGNQRNSIFQIFRLLLKIFPHI